MGARLSATDAFFVAYQEQAGIAMHLGVTVELRGELPREAILAGLRALIRRWPALGERIQVATLGLVAGPRCALDECLHEAPMTEFAWQNAQIDPFTAPPMQLHWGRSGGAHTLSLKVHHALLDGEGFLLAALHLIEAIAAAAGGRLVPDPAGHRAAPRAARPGPRIRLSQGPRDPWPRHARLALRSVSPGPTSVVSMRIESGELSSLRDRARRGGIGVPWWVMAAWMRALHAWNLERDAGQGPWLTIEVPASLRGGLSDPLRAGNHLAPLVLGASAELPLEALARRLKEVFKELLARGEPLASRALAASGALLPWSVFRRVAVTPQTTGDATSHVVFLSLPHALGPRVAELSGGQLTIAGHRSYTPVCLLMGAALTALEFPDQLGLMVSYRERALDEAEAAWLRDRCAAELRGG
jgi:hypothetical protein